MQIEMTIKGLMVDPVTNTPIVVLRDAEGQKVLPIWVGVFEANAIAVQIENVPTPRPMTHDLLKNVIYDLHATEFLSRNASSNSHASSSPARRRPSRNGSTNGWKASTPRTSGNTRCKADVGHKI
jgi:hypothetical protein